MKHALSGFGGSHGRKQHTSGEAVVVVHCIPHGHRVNG
jgi:hypothetical protein